jgi:hypothetical protein
MAVDPASPLLFPSPGRSARSGIQAKFNFKLKVPRGHVQSDSDAAGGPGPGADASSEFRVRDSEPEPASEPTGPTGGSLSLSERPRPGRAGAPAASRRAA